ncbi:MAG TPA: tetratricopeptide repeat protein [Leptolyngbyaceae cyanobacterium M33_DOE_097]|nr:tetratricopeptide repeat protein [Leptolyngbyaceae cyanobacterium M33_DOE_097]
MPHSVRIVIRPKCNWLLLSASFLIVHSSLPISVFPVPPSLAAPTLAQTPETKKAADRLLDQGIQQYQRKQYEAAIQSWQQALQLYQELKDRNGEAIALNNLGIAYRSLSQYETAIRYYKQALPIYQAVKDRNGEADALNNLGNAYGSLSQYEKALRYYEQALSIFQAVKDRNGEADALNNLGLANQYLSQYEKAIGYYEQALSIFQAVKDRNGEADALNNLGLANQYLSQYEKAIGYYEQALPIFQAVKDRNGEAGVLMNLGIAYRSLSQYEKAIGYYEQALPIFQAVKDRNGEAVALSNLGGTYLFLSQYEKAIGYYEQALPIFQAVKDRNGEAGVLTSLGIAYLSSSQYEKAIGYYEQALPIFQAIKDRNDEAITLNYLGLANQSLSQYEKAIGYYEQALPIFQAVKDRNGEASVLMNLGSTYLVLSQYEKGIGYYEQALPIYQAVKNRNGEAKALNNLGNAYGSLSQYEKAIGYYEQALPIFQAVKDRNSEAGVLNNLGITYLSLSEYEKAIRYYEQALPIYQAIKDRNGEAAALNNLGITYQRLSQYEKAIGYYEQALPIFQAVKDRDGEARALNNLGYILFVSGQVAQAEQTLRQSMQVLECLRVGLKDENKVSIFEEQTTTYRSLQTTLVAQNKFSEALEIAERGRARAFLELLAQRFGDSNTKAVKDGESDPVKPQSKTTCTSVKPPTLAEIQQVAQAQNATLVEYSIIDDKTLYIWVIQPSGAIAFQQVSLKSFLQGTSLAQLIANIREDQLGVRGLGVVPVQRSRSTQLPQNLSFKTLHQLMIAPIAQYLPEDPNQRIIFLPQGALFLVPFAALQDAEGTYLIQQHTIAIAPSIQTLQFTQQQRQRLEAKDSDTQPALIVGNPVMPKLTLEAGQPPVQLATLPNAEAEAKALAQLLQQPALLQNQATEAQVKALMPQARLIHLSTHGLFNDRLGLSSSVALTPTAKEDGLLTAAEILDLKLQADLVVLSACDTGRGQITGDGVIGLSRALFSAGTPSVIVSLWAVPDAPTAFLMTEFYKKLETTGDKAQALRQAMLSTLERYPKPREWAAFTLIGES